MYAINLKDGRKAPSKAREKGAKRLEFLVLNKARTHFSFRMHRPQGQNIVCNKSFGDFLLYVKMLGLKSFLTFLSREKLINSLLLKK